MSVGHNDRNIELIHKCSSKEIYRETFQTKPNTIIIYFLNKNLQKQIDAPILEHHSRYEIFREINRYLYDGVPQSIKCTVPQIYFTSDKLQALEMEDCGNTTLLDKGYDFGIYKKLIFWLAQLEKLYVKNNISHFIICKMYDSNIISKDLSKIIKHNHKDDRYDIKEKAKKILKKVTKIPIGICHRDFRPKNIMIYKNNDESEEPRILNVENMCIGPLTYDLATLLYDPQIVINEDDIAVLLRTYSLLVGVDYRDICLWTKNCVKLIKLLGT